MATNSDVLTAAPVLSTPDNHIFEQPAVLTQDEAARLSDEQLYLQYEIQRTVREIRGNGWKRVALQFPDEMLVDAPRVSEALGRELRRTREDKSTKKDSSETAAEGIVEDGKNAEGTAQDVAGKTEMEVDVTQNGPRLTDGDSRDAEERLTILADTSYGACCLDEIAAEHVDAEAVVHYGRTCLSPTARLPVVYVFTSKQLDLDVAVETFKATYPDRDEKVCLIADVPYSHHVSPLATRLQSESYTSIFATTIIRDPSSLLPNRTLPPGITNYTPEELREYSIFHISTPPTALLLILASRVKAIHIYTTSPTPPPSGEALQPAITTPLLRRRYALLTTIPSTPIIGILINTLSVSNYMSALSSLQKLISKAGKKYYTFVVGKLTPAKLANFAEVGVWVVVGCWESSLVEAREFYQPVVTPYELEVGLMGDEGRKWGGEWVGGFEGVLKHGEVATNGEKDGSDGNGDGLASEAGSVEQSNGRSWQDEASDSDEPPDFDLRTGRYVSHSRPMPRPRPVSTNGDSNTPAPAAPPSSALVQRPKADVAAINGALSPGAEFLKSKRTWQGLGSDYEVAYERDEEGRIRGAGMEEGRSGVARGYAVGGGERA